MTFTQTEHVLAAADCFLTATCSVVLLRRKLWSRFTPLFVYLAFRFTEDVILHLEFAEHIYRVYFWTYWPSQLISTLLTLWVVQKMFGEALAPLQGLQRIGVGIFRCICAVCFIAALAVSAGSSSGGNAILQLVNHFLRFESVLVLCALVFLTFAAHTLGMSYGSRIFTISLGFGIAATSDLILCALIGRVQMSSVIDLCFTFASTAVLVIWFCALLLPEPKRKAVMLSSNSLFVRWNSIAEQLGKPPVNVVVATPETDIFHPTEIAMHEYAQGRRLSGGDKPTALRA